MDVLLKADQTFYLGRFQLITRQNVSQCIFQILCLSFHFCDTQYESEDWGLF